MCGRYSLTKPIDALRQAFAFDDRPNLEPRWNIAPSQSVPIVRVDDDGRRRLAMVRWGLVPRWSEASAAGPINARAETVARNGLFREAFAERRCLVLADGFYEWQSGTKPKQPWRIVMADGAPMAFAGIWERWEPEGGGAPVETMAIVTTEANDTVAPIHERMPVVLDSTRAERWLSPRTSPGFLLELMRPCPAEWLTAYTVSRKVNAPAFDDPGCAEPWSEAPAQPRLL